MLELCEDDVYYAPLPLFHIAGQFALVYATCVVGATAVLPSTFSAQRFWQDVRSYQATTTFLLGAMANFLHAQEPAGDDASNPLERVLMVPLIPETEEQASIWSTSGRAETWYKSSMRSKSLMATIPSCHPGLRVKRWCGLRSLG